MPSTPQPQPGIFSPRRFEKIKDKIFGGTSDAVGFRDESGNEYVAKNNDLQPYVIANEMICNSIARRVGINSPDVSVVNAFGKDWFLSKFLKGSQALANIYPSDLLSIGVDLSPLALILCFDFWICNVDRHWGNLLVLGRESNWTIFAIDHDRALLGVENDCSGYNAICGSTCPNVLHTQFRRLAVENIATMDDFAAPLTLIESISETQLRWDFSAVGRTLLPKQLEDEMMSMMMARKGLLRTYVECLLDKNFVGN